MTPSLRWSKVTAWSIACSNRNSGRLLARGSPKEFTANADLFQGKVAQLEELRDVQQQWADGGALPDVEKARLKIRLKNLADDLSVPDEEVFTGAAMTDQAYARMYSELGDAEQGLGRRFTRAALKEAGL